MDNKKLKVIMSLIVIVVFVTLAASKIEVPYTIKAKAVFMPIAEYKLSRTMEGNLITSYKDNLRNVFRSYGVTEFKRGDVVEFVLDEKVYDKLNIEKGDTIGTIYSNEEQRNFILLQGQLDILLSELEFFTTGQKPEDVKKALKQVKLAQEELSIEEKLFERSVELFKDSVISQQQFEIAENKLEVKKVALQVAEANYESITTGEKPEQEKLIKTQIEVLKSQIDQVAKRIDYFTLISPVSGKILLSRGGGNSENIISIGDTTKIIAALPLQFSEKEFIKQGDKVKWKDMKGEVAGIDNQIKIIDNRQAFYATSVWDYDENILPGSIYDVDIECDEITLLEYFFRIFKFSSSH